MFRESFRKRLENKIDAKENNNDETLCCGRRDWNGKDDAKGKCFESWRGRYELITIFGVNMLISNFK